MKDRIVLLSGELLREPRTLPEALADIRCNKLWDGDKIDAQAEYLLTAAQLVEYKTWCLAKAKPHSANLAVIKDCETGQHIEL